MKYLGFYRKWIQGECRHLCLLCKHKRLCLEHLAEEERVKIELANYRQHIVDRFNNVK